MVRDKELKDQGRGSYEMKEASVVSVKQLAIKWIDNRSVTVLSSFDSVEPMKSVKWYDKEEKKLIEVQCSAAIANRNKNMGGVDLLDAFLSYYQINVRFKKLYHRLLRHFFPLAPIQGWILYKNNPWRGFLVFEKIQTFCC